MSDPVKGVKDCRCGRCGKMHEERALLTVMIGLKLPVGRCPDTGCNGDCYKLSRMEMAKMAMSVIQSLSCVPPDIFDAFSFGEDVREIIERAKKMKDDFCS